MIEIYPNLYIGSGADLIHADDGNGVHPDWYVITAARDPWHRDLLGYTTRGAPKDHAEYLMAQRERRLYLNLIDSPDPAFVREEIVATAIETIDRELRDGSKVLVHCNQGQSRAPTLGLLWVRWGTAGEPLLHAMMAKLTPEFAVDAFRFVYPAYAPSDGMLGYLKEHW